MMADMNDAKTEQLAPEPSPTLRKLEKLVGTWKVSGEAQGQVTFEWMEGGFFLIQHVDLEKDGHKIKGFEIIGHERGQPHDLGWGKGFSSLLQGYV